MCCTIKVDKSDVCIIMVCTCMYVHVTCITGAVVVEFREYGEYAHVFGW